MRKRSVEVVVKLSVEYHNDFAFDAALRAIKARGLAHFDHSEFLLRGSDPAGWPEISNHLFFRVRATGVRVKRRKPLRGQRKKS